MSKYLKTLLRGTLPDDELKLLYSSYDIIGDIAIIKIPEALMNYKNIIGKTLLKNIKNINTVLMQSNPVSGEYRLRDVDYIAGDEKYLTLYKEFGCKFLVNVATSYFSPRLSTERLRISVLVKPNELVLNMFAGVGTFSIVMAKKKPLKVINIDSNLDAHILDQINSKINGVQRHIISLHGDARNILQKGNYLNNFDRILLPLPEKAYEFLDVALSCLKQSGGIIHFFSHVKSDAKKKVVFESEKHIARLFSERTCDYQILHTQIVRDVAPRIYQTVTDIQINKL
ncbi:class I SAM-dependent methyltransferase [Candidatus Nitrosocosmicus franklandus]|uniref:tRNA (guanine(37)-N(1))-methyltransferase n=1 Tax=Candidatus Nitrosocosmicus franklandianus TaxID=1798806 RepID=A0A484IE60_9ARCH|nr:class I SAM-dependent methyltransferase family protein [Candidatus Nitrosocosmicus franklandus]VFJ15097.1 Met-10+ like-protein [Candidatus Nitrosocosmicus franklandus]